MNEAKVQQAMEQAKMSARMSGVSASPLPGYAGWGKHSDSSSWTVTLAYRDWERLVLAIEPLKAAPGE